MKQRGTYFDGLLDGYSDCADVAERLMKNQRGFVEGGVKEGLDRRDAQIAAQTGESILKMMADAFRSKAALAEKMITAAQQEAGSVQ